MKNIYRAGDVLQEKVTGWSVVLIKPNWRIEGGGWAVKVWESTGDGKGLWAYRDMQECELQPSQK